MINTMLTADQYDQLSPKEQGYACYMQGAINPAIPQKCPYPEGFAKRQWLEGQAEASIDAQEVES